MSTEMLAVAGIAGIALGMNEKVRKSIVKAGGVTSAALDAGKSRFTQPEADLVQATTVTELPRKTG